MYRHANGSQRDLASVQWHKIEQCTSIIQQIENGTELEKESVMRVRHLILYMNAKMWNIIAQGQRSTD